MNINKCKSCANYDSFFNSCQLYYRETYLDGGQWDLQPIDIKHITSKECNYNRRDFIDEI